MVIILSSSLWPLVSYMVLLCAALTPFFTTSQLCWFLSFLCWPHSLLPQGLCIYSSFCLPCSSFSGFFFLLSGVHITFQSHFLKEATLCKTPGASLPSLFFPCRLFHYFLPLPRIPSPVCMGHRRREGRVYFLGFFSAAAKPL